MKALIFETYPVDVERRKASILATPVFGAYVYHAQAAAALLKYGSYDRCFVACADPAPRFPKQVGKTAPAAQKGTEH